MRPSKAYEKAQPYMEREKLPIGGYILKILDAKEVEYSWGNVLQISFDIAEGEHKGFFKDDYNSQTQEDKKWRGTYRISVPQDDGSDKDEWKARRMKTEMHAIEDSNPGYHFDWDEGKLKNKIVGAVFRNEEWEFDGRTGWRTACAGFKAVDTIRSGKFKIPDDKPLKPKAQSGGQIPEGFTEIDDSDIPF